MKLSPLADAMADDIIWLLYDTEVEREDFVRALVELAHYYGSYKDVEAFFCLDCQVDTSRGEAEEYYMVHTELWLEVNPGNDGMLCIGCLEKRLGRELTRADFTDAPINELGDDEWPKSDRLVNRLSRI